MWSRYSDPVIWCLNAGESIMVWKRGRIVDVLWSFIFCGVTISSPFFSLPTQGSQPFLWTVYHFLLSKVNPRSYTLKPLHVYLFTDLIFYILSACLSLEGLFHPHLNVFIFLPLLNASNQRPLSHHMEIPFHPTSFPSPGGQANDLLMPHSFLHVFHLSLTLPDSPNSHLLSRSPSQKWLSTKLPLAAYLLNHKDIFQSLPVLVYRTTECYI